MAGSGSGIGVRSGLAAVLVMSGSLVLGGCKAYAYTNERLKPGDPPESQASFDVKPRPGGNEEVMVLLALSGGGSRAAYFAGAVMLELEREGIDLLQEVDAISSVSGGSLPAAYYCLSRDPSDPEDSAPRVWDRDTVLELMGNNYLLRWFGNWFWPINILLHWTTAFDRTDIMAQTFADSLFDQPLSGVDLSIGALNPRRPHLILNATDATENTPAWKQKRPDGREDIGHDIEKHYGNVFTFTREDFTNLLHSDINGYSLSRAVMASATFPSVFPYMTLRDFRDGEDGERRYVHVFDGGNSDNLGLKSVERLIGEAEHVWSEGRPRHYVVICVDAYTRPRGVNRTDADPRDPIDYVVDRNFLDAIDALMAQSRWGMLLRFIRDRDKQEDLREQQIEDSPQQQTAPVTNEDQAKDLDLWMQSQQSNLPQAYPMTKATDPEPPPPEPGAPPADPRAPAPPAGKIPKGWQPKDLDNLTFWHIQFRDVKDKSLRARLNKIPTNFLLPDGADDDLENAARQLIRQNREKVDEVRAALGMQPSPLPRPPEPPPEP